MARIKGVTVISPGTPEEVQKMLRREESGLKDKIVVFGYEDPRGNECTTSGFFSGLVHPVEAYRGSKESLVRLRNYEDGLSTRAEQLPAGYCTWEIPISAVTGYMTLKPKKAVVHSPPIPTREPLGSVAPSRNVDTLHMALE